tara:strand:+ start:1231 stop:2238 length:1008 start_codon:yes stop_codon:yes gene_type:complete
MFSLVLILNLLSELDFFKNINVNTYFPLYLSLLNSVSLVFEMLPFIFLISAQFFFINFFKNNELDIFKYSGLKNTSIMKILSLTTLLMGIFFIVLFYNFASNLKNIYLELKSNYTSDNKYLAVITNNGLWIKDRIDGKILIINSNKIEPNFLVETFISEFDENFKNIRNIQSNKINIESNEWLIKDAKVYNQNISSEIKNLKIKSNFNYERIQTLFSNLSSLSFLELLDLKKNNKLLGYSTVKVDVHLYKLLSYPFYFILIVIFSSIIMFNSKNYKSTSTKIAIGLFSSVLIYYINNFFYVLGNTQRISIILAICFPLLMLGLINILMIRNINDK